MKKLLIAGLAGLLVFTLVNTAFAEEEDDIVKKHEKWLGKVMLGSYLYNNKPQLENPTNQEEASAQLGGVIIPTVTYTMYGILKEAPPISIYNMGETHLLVDYKGKVLALIKDTKGTIPADALDTAVKIETESLTPVPESPGLYLISDITSFKMMSSSPLDNQTILNNIEAAVRNVPVTPSGRFDPSKGYDANFDFNDDGLINSSDQITIRYIWTLPDDKYIAAHVKLMNAAYSRIGVTSSNPRFISAFDVNGNGIIEMEDCEWIASALTVGPLIGGSSDPVFIEPLGGVTIVKPDNSAVPIKVDPGIITPGTGAEPIIINPKPPLTEPVPEQPVIGVAPNLPFKEPIESPVITLPIPIDDKNGGTDQPVYGGPAILTPKPNLTIDDQTILNNIEATVRNRPVTPSGRFDPSKGYDANFDFNDDGLINSQDQITVRNIWTLSSDKFITAYNKLIAAVQERMGLVSGDPGFISAFDANSNGVIDLEDSYLIDCALMIGRSDPTLVEKMNNEVIERQGVEQEAQAQLELKGAKLVREMADNDNKEALLL